MTERFWSADQLENIVGACRQSDLHIGRAVSAEQRVYILHSYYCLSIYDDLRLCPFSLALDEGIDASWAGWEDRTVMLGIRDGKLIAARTFQ